MRQNRKRYRRVQTEYSLKDDIIRVFATDKETIKDLFKERVDYQILRLREIFGLEYIKDRL